MTSLIQTVKHMQEERLEETTSAFSKIEQLVRMGLMSSGDLGYLKRAMVQMESGSFMPTPERTRFYKFVTSLMELTLNDPAIHRQLKNKVAHMKEETAVDEAVVRAKSQSEIQANKTAAQSDTVKADLAKHKKKTADAVAAAAKEFEPIKKAPWTKQKALKTIFGEETVNESVNFRSASDAMLQGLSQVVFKKRRAGGHPTEADRAIATKAKAELRRRRNVKTEGYDVKLEAAMKHFEYQNIAEIPEDKLQEFFTYIDSLEGVQ